MLLVSMKITDDISQDYEKFSSRLMVSISFLS